VADDIGDVLDGNRSAGSATEASLEKRVSRQHGATRSRETDLDELLAVLLEQLPDLDVGDGRNLDQLCETVADLAERKSGEEREVKEGHARGVVGSETVLELAVVDSDLDRYCCINETDDSRRDTNEVGRSTVGRATVDGENIDRKSAT